MRLVPCARIYPDSLLGRRRGLWIPRTSCGESGDRKSPEEIHRPRGRHLSGASRGVGVRLVRDCAGQHAATAAEVADSINGWVRSLARRDRPLRDIDEALAGALAGLQADRGLRPHVGAGAGKPGDR